MRAAIYARYSSDLQSETSIDDQVRLCRERAEREGWQIVEVFTDYAISGGSLNNRPSMLSLLGQGKQQRFDVVIAEALDRISRDQEDIAGIYKRLSHADIQIHTLSEGDINELHIGLKGTMNALFLKDLADKIRRGQKGRTIKGKASCSVAYGYDVVKELNADGEIERGQRRINPVQAEVIRRIFNDYSSGISPRAIAKKLNGENIPAPRGGQWNASTINGNRKRRDGILWNELYIGRLIYNRQTFVKDPESGKRIPRPNPESDWVVVEVPELRIVEQETWQRVRDIKAKHADHKAHLHRRPKHLLSGIIKCGVCGGSYTVIGEDRFGCTTRREKGTCSNNKTISASKLEKHILYGIKEQMLAPELIQEFADEFRREFKSLQEIITKNNKKLASSAKKLDMRIEHIVNAIENGADFEPLKKRLQGLEQERLTAQSSAPEVDKSILKQIDPDLADIYQQKVTNLELALNQNTEVRQEAVPLLRALIDKVVLHPGEKRGELTVEMHGQMAAIANLNFQKKEGEVGVKVVAEEGLEPPTRGL